MCAGRVFHATDALKKKEVGCLVVRAAGRISCLGFLWDRGLREETKGGRQFVSGCCWRLRKRWSRHKLAISRRQRRDGQSRAWSSSLLGVRWVCVCGGGGGGGLSTRECKNLLQGKTTLRRGANQRRKPVYWKSGHFKVLQITRYRYRIEKALVWSPCGLVTLVQKNCESAVYGFSAWRVLTPRPAGSSLYNSTICTSQLVRVEL